MPYGKEAIATITPVTLCKMFPTYTVRIAQKLHNLLEIHYGCALNKVCWDDHVKSMVQKPVHLSTAVQTKTASPEMSSDVIASFPWDTEINATSVQKQLCSPG